MKVSLTLLVWLLGSAALRAVPVEHIEFFEAKIRPILAQDCYECHNSRDKAKAGLVLDHRAGLLEGGRSGPAILPGDADASLLIRAIRHEDEDLQMPKAGVKLDPPIIEDFVRWVNLGAPDPRDAPPSEEELAEDTNWDAVLERRKAWWSFQPITDPEPPASDWSQHPVDRFLHAKMEDAGLAPSERAEPVDLVRRIYFHLIGLPPTPAQVDDFLASGASVEELVDELLASPHFGEKWARHWMDWIRYAESHGSEGDPGIGNAHLYRDYLIRALNADIPVDQLLREHVAGDLLPKPRRNEELGLDESLIGASHWRMVFHGFAPTDALEEKVRFTDDQINVFTKAFLGLTVSCARCHDHKFDAISQADYYALFGILGSTRPGRFAADLPERLTEQREPLADRKADVREALAQDWLEATEDLPERLLDAEGLVSRATQPGDLLDPVFRVQRELAQGAPFAAAWKRRLQDWARDEEQIEQQDELRKMAAVHWEPADPAKYRDWFPQGPGLAGQPAPAGDFALAPDGQGAVEGIYPRGVYSHLLSSKYGARLTSLDVHLDEEYDLWVRVRGGGQASARYVVQNYPRRGTVYRVAELKDEGKQAGWQWKKFDLAYWQGDDIHLELATAKDAPLLTKDRDRSWFGVREAMLLPHGAPKPVETREERAPLFVPFRPSPPGSLEDWANRIAQGVRDAVERWSQGEVTDREALFLDACLEAGILPNRLHQLPRARPLIESYREIEAEVPVATRVPGLAEWEGRDQPLFVRGNHKKPGEPVPRRFLEAIDKTAYESGRSGRLELAEDLLREDNPFPRRVLVNRVWHHLFGQGIVSTVDNFGRLGEEPTHSALLDHLAMRFGREQDWSIKDLIRYLVTSRAWQLSSRPSQAAREKDPENRLLSHARVRRLEAEAIRDSLLAVSGRLDPEMFPDPQSGTSPHRSVYVRVIRNRLDPFLATFNAPVPFSTKGARDVTNVPAQSLTLLNDDFVLEVANQFADRFEGPEADRIDQMWRTALGREPEPGERAAARHYLRDLRARYGTLAGERRELAQGISERQREIQHLLDPVRKRLEAKRGLLDHRRAPEPLAHWEFEGDARDSAGGLHGTFQGTARIEDGALVLDGNGFVRTQPLGMDLQEKTLSAVVLLETLEQRGGGVITVQNRKGDIFDSIVYGERRPGEWLAGSNRFARTDDFGGAPERAAARRPVHVAIAYDADGVIRGYRNGELYGKAYRKAGLQPYGKDRTEILFGLRHGQKAAGSRALAGRILEARLFDRALPAKEIAAVHAEAGTISEDQVRAALSEIDRTTVQRLETELEELRARQAELPDSAGPKQAWTDLAHALLNLKEFVYLK